jgi:methylthioribose-1-phosphate isomerase
VAAHQLAQLDIAHTVIPDSAVGWLLANRQLDAAFLRGDTIGESGDVVALVGALSVARLAAGTGVPVVVLGPSASIVADGTDLRQLTPAVISAAESGAARRARLNPTTDLVPGELIAAWVTEQGVIRATPLDGPR